jgi:hypothetical protein
MEYKDTLPIKYLTDTYKLLKDYPSSETDIIFTIIDDIKKSRRTKKNWDIDDFIFSKEIIDDNIINIEKLVSDGYIDFNSDTQLFTITKNGLSLIFKI